MTTLLLSVGMKMNTHSVYVRGCPGVGTTWFTENLGCLFDDLVERTVVQAKHSGCHIGTVSDPKFREQLLDPSCSWERDRCVHAVITRHPSAFKVKLRRGDPIVRPEALEVWEAYYSAWLDLQMEQPAGAVRLFRYEDLVSIGCTSARADREVASFFLEHARGFDPARLPTRNATVWALWKYEPFVLNDRVEHTTEPSAIGHLEL